MVPGYGYGIGEILSSSNSASTRGGGGTPFANKYSLNFDGVDDVIPIRTMASMSGVLAEVSYSYWIKTSTPGVYGAYECAFGGYSSAGAVFNIGKLGTPYGTTDLVIYGGGVARTTVLNDGNWHHIVSTFNKTTKEVVYYVDGNVEGTMTFPSYINHFGIAIGSGGDLSYYFFNGLVDECSVWSNVLTPTEVTSLYNSGTPTDLTSLSPIYWYRNGDNGTWQQPQWLIPSNENKDNVSNYSFAFDGTDDYVNTGASTLSGETALTISAWVYPTAYGDATAPSFVSTDEASPRAFYLGLFNGTNFRFSISTNGTSLTSLDTASSTVTLNAWQHILVTWDQVDLKLYKNGVLLKTVATTSSSNGTFTTTNNLLIGARRSSAGFFNGNIDEVAIWNTAKTQSDITAIYNSGTPTTITGAVAHWKMGEGSIFTNNWLVDNSFSPDRALKFDNTYITSPPWAGYQGIAASTNVISSDHITFSAWFKSTDSANTQSQIFKTSLYNMRLYSNRVYLFKAGATYRYWDVSDLFNGGWHNIIIYIPNTTTWDLADAKIYSDGLDLGTGTGIGGSGAGTLQITDIYGIFKKGAGGGPTITAEVSNWAYWLSDKRTDVSTIYNSGVPGDLSSLSPDVWWKLDSGTVTTDIQVDVIDSSGNGVTGSGPRDSAKTIPALVASTVNSQPPYSTRSFAFDGVDDEIDCGDVLHNDGQTPMSLSAWINITNTGDYPIAGKKKVRAAPLYARRGWDVTIDTAGISANKLTFTLVGVDSGGSTIGTIQTKALTFAFTDGLWHHVVVTYDGSENASGVKFYKDGIEDTSIQILSDSFSGNSVNDPTVDFKIGTKPEYSGSSFYDGSMDELAIWSTTALTQEQVTTLYNGGLPDRIDGATAWWRMGEDANYSISGAITGTNTGISSGFLTDSAATFLTDNLTVGDIVTNLTDSTYSWINTIVDDHNLILNHDIFLTPAGDSYRIVGPVVWTVPDNAGSNTGTSVNMTIQDMVGEAPNYTGGGTSVNMTLEDRIGDAPNSTSNALSLNMDEVDRETDVPT